MTKFLKLVVLVVGIYCFFFGAIALTPSAMYVLSPLICQSAELHHHTTTYRENKGNKNHLVERHHWTCSDGSNPLVRLAIGLGVIHGVLLLVVFIKRYLRGFFVAISGAKTSAKKEGTQNTAEYAKVMKSIGKRRSASEDTCR